MTDSSVEAGSRSAAVSRRIASQRSAIRAVTAAARASSSRLREKSCQHASPTSSPKVRAQRRGGHARRMRVRRRAFEHRFLQPSHRERGHCDLLAVQVAGPPLSGTHVEGSG
jgi:hypothetical protein